MNAIDLTAVEIERFWKRVEKKAHDECWKWKGGNTGKTLYGSVMFFREGKWKHYRTHRISYQIANGEIPDGLCVCHACDNPICVNPAHLWLGTIDENNKDKKQKNRQTKGSDVHFAKLDDMQVSEMCQLYADGGSTQADLGKRFGVCSRTVAQILRNPNAWRHVEKPVLLSPNTMRSKNSASPVGEAHYNTTLTEADVKEIRRL